MRQSPRVRPDDRLCRDRAPCVTALEKAREYKFARLGMSTSRDRV